MASDEAGGADVSFGEAIRVEKVDLHTYRIDLNDAFCIGKVSNGGYTASCMLAAARAHLSSHGQPDTLTAHFEYPRQTTAGAAIVAVEDIKLSSRLSTLHLTLWQGSFLADAPWIDRSVSRRTVLAYTTHTNLRTSTGITLPTGYEATRATALPSPLPAFEALETRGLDDCWEESKLLTSSGLWRSLRNWRFYIPRKGPLTPGVMDMWVHTASGEHIPQSALPYVVDSFPYNLHTFLVAPEARTFLEASQGGAGVAGEKKKTTGEADQRPGLWFPTVLMNLEVKKALPEEGVEWLAVRVTSKQIKDGRFDLDVLVRDVGGELVALSHHVAMILSIERNTGNKRDAPKAIL
ncbi:MAG: hypothetical protein Q9160_005604 [Pyrenula sp. 1 TL-2023]